MGGVTHAVGADGVGVLTLDLPQGLDALDTAASGAVAAAIDALLGDAAVRGIVIHFPTASDPVAVADAGALTAELRAVADAAARRKAALARVSVLQAALRRLETGGKPAAAAIAASLRGGAFEVALACHRRVVADDAALRLGMPRVSETRIPSGGATQRLVRMAGEMAALKLLHGGSLTASDAQAAKLVDEVVPGDAVLARATAWVQAAGAEAAVRPWDTKMFRLPGADPRTHHGGGQFAVANALQRKATGGRSAAADAVQQLAYQACLVPMDVGLRLESKYAARLLIDAAAH